MPLNLRLATLFDLRVICVTWDRIAFNINMKGESKGKYGVEFMPGVRAAAYE